MGWAGVDNVSGRYALDTGLSIGNFSKIFKPQENSLKDFNPKKFIKEPIVWQNPPALSAATKTPNPP